MYSKYWRNPILPTDSGAMIFFYLNKFKTPLTPYSNPSTNLFMCRDIALHAHGFGATIYSIRVKVRLNYNESTVASSAYEDYRI